MATTITTSGEFGTPAAVNAAVLAKATAKPACYAIRGKRVPYKWVSAFSSCVIARSEAAMLLRRVGVSIDEVEAA
jgi:hypothetical protein